MFISAAVLKNISNLKIVHKPVTKSCHGGFAWGKGGPAMSLGALLLPPLELDPDKALEDGIFV